MKKFFDIESGDIVTIEELENEFACLKLEDPDEYLGITFNQYLNNCMTVNGGTLEYIGAI